MTAAELTRHLTNLPDRVADVAHRTAPLTIRVVDARGEPVRATVTVTQTSADFQFGANCFMLDGYPTPAANAAYEEAFRGLFNTVAVPFYWDAYEPRPGHLRFGVDSEPVFRRPPPDRVLAWCAEHGLRPKGHNLVWASLLPDWLPADPEAVRRLADRHFQELAQRYAGRLDTWDVANEHLRFKPGGKLPDDYLEWSFHRAAELFPTARLFVNETTHDSWPEPTRVLNLVRDLRAKGCRVGGLGLQFHLFQETEKLGGVVDTLLNPEHLLRVLDRYAELELPLHISEITIPSAGALPGGRELQAALTEGLYRTWFSHPAVEAIIWWNVPDGAAWKTEGRLLAGVVDEELRPKPVYEALRKLIHQDWRTRLTATVDGPFRCRGFCGDYTITVESAGGRREHRVTVTAGAVNEFELPG